MVMATPEDMNANAEYIRMADEIVEVPNGTNNRNYANVVLIVGIAEQVWNPVFVALTLSTNLTTNTPHAQRANVSL